MSGLRPPAPRGRPLLSQLRDAGHDRARDRGAQDGHGPVRGPRRLHGAGPPPRPGTDAGGAERFLRRRERGAPRAAGPPGEVHRGRRHGGLRAPAGPRGRRRARGAGGPRDPRSDAAAAGIPRSRRTPRDPRRDRDRRGGHGGRPVRAAARDGTRRERRVALAGGRPAGRGARGSDHPPAHGGLGLVRRSARGGRQGVPGDVVGASGPGPHHALGPAHDPVRRSLERTRHPPRELREGEGDVDAVARFDPG
jgi:hypothetical protein